MYKPCNKPAISTKIMTKFKRSEYRGKLFTAPQNECTCASKYILNPIPCCGTIFLPSVTQFDPVIRVHCCPMSPNSNLLPVFTSHCCRLSVSNGTNANHVIDTANTKRSVQYDVLAMLTKFGCESQLFRVLPLRPASITPAQHHNNSCTRPRTQNNCWLSSDTVGFPLHSR